RLVHGFRDAGRDVLRGDLEVARDMALAENFQVPGSGSISKRKIVSDAGADEHFFHPRHIADLLEKFSDLLMTRPEGWAGRRAGLVRACSRRAPAIASHTVHVCR